MRSLIGLLLLLLVALTSCQLGAPSADAPLPILGEFEVVDGDTIYHTVRDFSFVNQDSQIVNNATFANKAYVVDFFFISCPTICPKVKKQMLRLHERFKNENQLVLLSHTIDTKHDTIPRLKKFATDMRVGVPQWHFVTGEKDSIYSIASDYFSIAQEDPNAPGGFDHSGRLILVDPQRRVRAFCDGTDPKSVDQFMQDIERLLKEMK